MHSHKKEIKMIKNGLETILPAQIRRRAGKFLRTLRRQELFRIRFPSKIDIELTNICNLRCVMCPEITMSRKKGFMEFETFKKITDECANHYVQEVVLNIMGESLLHPKFSEIVIYAKKHLKNVGLNTNACFLKKEISKNIIDAGMDWIRFSLDAAHKETYEKIRIGANFEMTMSNVEEFFKIRKESNSLKPRVVLQFIEQKENCMEHDDFIKKWGSFLDGEDIIAIKFANDWGGQVKDVGTFIAEIVSDVCISPWQSETILWDGEVVMCCVDFDGKVKLGNIKNKSLFDIWNGPEFKKLRMLVENKDYEKLPICRACDMTSGRSFSNINITKKDIISMGG